MARDTRAQADSPGAASGEASARVRELVELHWAFIGRLLRHMGVRNDVDDALQQVFMTLVQKLENVERGKERAFLAGCAVHVAARYRRKLAAESTRLSDEQPAELEALVLTPEEHAERRHDLERLDGVLASMPEDARSVFLLYEVEELTMQEIALALSIPQGTVASRLRRARDVLHKRLTR